ncbi:hypothetical protein IF650_13015 [Cellulosimicrobium terreum]|nr:hypothetical protein [Cellulosimicrobium terreum]
MTPPETEPSAWELMRLLRTVDGKLDQVVTKDMFQAESRRVDERLDEQGRDIADERVARGQQIADERRAREKQVLALEATFKSGIADERAAREKNEKAAADRQDKSANNLRWLAAGLLLPIALFVANLLVARGGA